MEAKTLVSEIQSEHPEWLKKLKLTKDELSSFDQQLGDVIKKNNISEIARHVEHFQNQFIRQKEVIDELRHEIKQYENTLEVMPGADLSEPQENLYNHRMALIEQMETFEKIYGELKDEYQKFLNQTS
ncbi:MAG: hypothetical protein ACHQK8_07520 [Bacteroidia bacterium]